MRPVERGSCPKDPSGNDAVFNHYRDARDPLIARIGDYCSYCEVCLHGAIHVEHVRPKDPHPALEREWTNFLLACDSCNSVKSDKDVVLDDYFWPDRDNTARVFDYELDEPPRISTGLNAGEQAMAKRTLDLTGLNRVPDHPQFSDRDRRWLKRREAWGIALQARRDFEANPSPELRRAIMTTAVSRGYWSVWMQVFHDHQEMRQSLIDWFRGTAGRCFGSDTRPLPRPGGRA